ncbi:virion structural protein [Staphylococcus phage phiSA_BS1]|uniref:Uncharacterized protein n=2 Tax=Baoshanvirus TaxID=2732969 RepID=A0A2P1MXY9_9CAUD|nr:virion structural protein [Staphylococcus phage phiSA_BS1]YP_009799952.1 virion structural protein [Staphylococcus phage phiSA_BS2]AVP40442.1 hypothetical protein [Staphylococcus phage phiSA_BS1]AVR55556.1 hypothetical protein phiSABS2_112 [Staphylococcus phage phiSA_BS2]
MSNFLKNLHPLLKRKKNTQDNKDPHYAIINMFSEELDNLEQETIDSKIQSSLDTATGKYLDIYGDWYGLVRKKNELDDTYRDRIIEYVLLKRGTNNSIIGAIKRFLEDEDVYVDIYEPFKNIFYTNKSHLNGEDHLMGDYYRFAIIDITIGKSFPLEIIDEINKFKPAGVKVYFTYDGSYDLGEDKIITPVFYKDYPKVTTYQDVDIFRGYGRILYGHLNLGIAKVNDITDVFKTNNSLVNSLDVLSGSATVGREFYNYAYKTQHKYEPRTEDYVTTISSRSIRIEEEELNKDFYTETSTRNNIKPELVIEGNNRPTNIHFNLDTVEYLRRKGIVVSSLGMDEQELINYVSNYFGEVSLDLDIQAMVSPSNPVSVKLSIYDFRSYSWVTVSREDLNLTEKNIGNKIGNLIDYLNDNLSLFIKLEVEPVREETELRIGYFDLTFRRYEKDIYTVKPFLGRVEPHQETSYLAELDAIKDIDIDNGDIITKSGYRPMQYLRLTDGYDNSINRNLLLNTTTNIKNKEDTRGSYNQYWFTYIDEAHKYFNVGDYITISFDVEMDRGDLLRVYDSNHNRDFMFGSVVFENIGSQKQRLEFTRKLEKATKDSENWQLAFFADDNGDNFSIKNIKVEFGEESTPYQPNPEDIYGANDPNKYIDILPRDKDNNVINNKVLPIDYEEENVQFLDKLVRFNGVYNNVQTISINNTIPIPKAIIETSVYGTNYNTLKTFNDLPEGETHTDNELVDLYGIKNLTYQTLNPFSQVIIRPFLDFTITKLMEDIGNIVDLPNGFFNALWQEVDIYSEHKNPTPIVLEDVANGIIDNSTGEIVKIPNQSINTYTDSDVETLLPAEYKQPLTLDSNLTLGELADTELSTKEINITHIPQVTTESSQNQH